MPDAGVIIFLAVFGACIGSFLNVVVYRLPRGLSLVRPGSHCPRCNCSIRWYDNIPVVSYLALRGRCRSCECSIGAGYSVVELATAVAFVALYDAFYISGMHTGLYEATIEWPVFTVHLCLIAALIVCCVLDIEYYFIDLRVLYLFVPLALVGWTVGWRHGDQYLWPTSGPGVLAGSLGVVLGELLRRIVSAVVTAGRLRDCPGDLQQEQEDPLSEPKPASGKPHQQVLLVAIFAVSAVVIIVWAIVGAQDGASYEPRVLAYGLWLFACIIVGSVPRRSADQQVVEAIELERHGARAQAGLELCSLMPACVGAAVAVGMLKYWPTFDWAVGWAFDLNVLGFQPLAGLAASLSGLLIAAGLGWAVRIGFTLLFGREAMGMGDIYILAAIGAGAGSMVAIVGFFAGSVIGVFGVGLLLLWKRLTALSYGPWIGIGALICILMHDAVVAYLRPAALTFFRLMHGD